MPTSTGLMRRAKRNVRQTGRALRRDRMGDFRRATDINEAIFQNLTGGIRQGRRALNRSNARVLSQLQRLSEGMAVQGRRTTRREQQLAQSLYGAAASGAAFAPARARAGATAGAGRAGVRWGQSALSAGNRIMNIAQQGAREAEAGAEYATAQALSQRTSQDQSLVAQMRHEVIMAELQQQFALEQMQAQAELDRRRLRFEQRLAERAMGNDFQGAQAVVNDMGEVSRQIRDILSADPEATLDGEGGVLAQLTESGLLDASNVTQTAMVRRLFGLIREREIYQPGYSDEGRENEVQAILDTLQSFYPTWFRGQREDRLRNWVEAYLNDMYSRIGAANPMSTSSDVPSPMPSPQPGPMARYGPSNSAAPSPMPTVPSGYLRGGP